MSIPTNIEKEHLLKAIEKIDHEGITYETDSMYYDAKYNSKFYPPKLVVSFANIFANGTELDRNTFEGGINKPCFKLLEKHGFEIVTKELDTFNSEEEIKKYLSHFKNEELLQQFFEVAKIIFSFPNLTEKDKRIAFTLRKNGKQVSLNLGRKLVLAISKIKNQNSLCFYLSEKDASWAKNLPGYLKEEVFNTNPPARLLYFDASINLLQNMELISKVKTGIEELLPTVESAGQPERHNPLIYHLIMNEKVRTEMLNSEVITPSLKEQVMVYEVKNSAVQNALELRTDNQSYFYWNDLTFKKLSLGDYVFVVIKGNHEVLFTQLDDKEIKINKTDTNNTYFTDLNKDYTVSGKYDQFVRLKVLLKIEAPKEWKWKTLGSSETTYLSGKNINKDKADNRLANIRQLMELSDDQRYNEVLHSCLSNFEITNNTLTNKQNSNLIPSFTNAAAQQNLIFSSFLTKRYIASLATKPFVIFTGLSGSGKTKLAQTFAKWICEGEAQYKIIPVGADWTNREPLLGYPNSLNPNSYVLPDNGALDLIIAAIDNAKDKKLKDCKPYFLILDEMNLSHVERYFADFLSGMESKEAISLYTGNDRKDENDRQIPKEIKLPPNLFMVGTVNIDETTYMFSPKVLDRANTIEFRVDKNDLLAFFDAPNEEPSSAIDGSGASYSNEFMKFVAIETDGKTNYQEPLLDFFKALQPIGAEFGYRTANEMNRLVAQLEALGLEKNEHALDVAVMQKLLPKLHGSRTKLNKVLPILASFCFDSCSSEQAKALLDEVKREGQLLSDYKPTLPLSFAKIARMYAAAQENGFASYAEG
jgi:5-methylcytosine-specific restriction protein B